MAEQNDRVRQVILKPEKDEVGDFPLAQHLFVTQDEHHIYLRFLQVVPPVILNDEMPDSVTGRLVASVCIPAALVPTLARLFRDVGRKYEDSTGRTLDWGEEGQPT